MPLYDAKHITIFHMSDRFFYSFVKRTFDIIAPLCGAIVLIPVTLIVGLAIKIEDWGPIFFKQARFTKDGKPFRLIKFRSMVVNAEALRDSLEEQNEMDGPVFKIKKDKRITKVGRLFTCKKVGLTYDL